jgi:hypothetical protein
LKKQLKNSNKNWVTTYNIVSSKTNKKQNKKIKKYEIGFTTRNKYATIKLR